VVRFFWPFFPDERREWVLNNIEFTKLTQFTITDRGELEQQLEDIRVKGFATEVQENELGASCIAAPIFGPFDEVVASISVAGVVHRMSPERVAEISSELTERCARLSRNSSRSDFFTLKRQILHADLRLSLGEGPVWDCVGGFLYFVDIEKDSVFKLQVSTGDVDKCTVRRPSAIGLCRSGRLIIACQAGVVLLDFENGIVTPICNPIEHSPLARLNDGKVAPDGSFLGWLYAEQYC
jgi:hypothetical protein